MNVLDIVKQLLGGARAIKLVDKPHGWGLGIGVNELSAEHYGAKYPLVACENDARHMMHMLSQEGYVTKTLLTKQATRDAVLDAIYTLARKAQPGDIVAIHNSSHGSQVKDYNSEEKDGMDETICMYDGQIIDDELELAWSKFEKGVRVLFTSDSCHSGTMLKLFEPNVPSLMLREGIRALPLNVAVATNERNDLFYRAVKEAVGIQPKQAVTASVLSSGACADNQVAMDGRINGAYTGALLSVLDTYPSECLGRVFTRVGHVLAPSQTPSYMYLGPRIPSFESAPAFRI